MRGFICSDMMYIYIYTYRYTYIYVVLLQVNYVIYVYITYVMRAAVSQFDNRFAMSGSVQQL